MNLNNSKPGEAMKTLLQKGRYFRDEKDIDLISTTFERARALDTSAIENIGDLNKKEFNINADVALAQGGESFKKRVAAERIYLGFTEDDSAIFKQQQNAATISFCKQCSNGQLQYQRCYKK